jgi:hypothetical protein
MKGAWKWIVDCVGVAGVLGIALVTLPVTSFFLWEREWIDAGYAASVITFVSIVFGSERVLKAREAKSRAARIAALEVVCELEARGLSLRDATLEQLEIIREGLKSVS